MSEQRVSDKRLAARLAQMPAEGTAVAAEAERRGVREGLERAMDACQQYTNQMANAGFPTREIEHGDECVFRIRVLLAEAKGESDG